MVDLQAGYNVPGVYVRDTTGPLVANGGFPESVVTLVGPATGFQTDTDVLALTADAKALDNRGVWLDASATGAPPGVFSLRVTTLSGVVLVAGTDYVTSVIFETTGDPTTAITTLALGPLTTQPATVGGTDYTATANGIKSGTQVIATYCYTDATYYSPLMFEDFDRVEDVYGDALLAVRPNLPTSPEIVSPLSFAALVAFANGATRVMCVATKPSDGAFSAQLTAAYAKTEGDYRSSLIVPILATSDNGDPAAFDLYASGLRTHVEASSNGGYQRIGVIGAAKEFGQALGASAPSFANVAKGIASRRVLLAYPNRVNFFNTGTGRAIEVSGYYLAVAYAARLSANPVQIGLTRQQVYGFAGFPASIQRVMTKRFKDDLSSAGVAVTETDRQNRLVIRHGLSTDTTSVVTREVSITRARDALFDALQIGLDTSGLIGAPIDAEMTMSVKGAVQGILESATSNGTIVAYADLKVRQQTAATGGDPTVIECKFAYQPAVPLNYVLVSFSLNLQSGAVSLTDAA